MIYTLIMLVCLSDAPEACEVREHTVELNPGTAFMQAQPIVAQWLEKHPGHIVQRWRLLPGRGV
jgi:hypothetical protein